MRNHWISQHTYKAIWETIEARGYRVAIEDERDYVIITMRHGDLSQEAVISRDVWEHASAANVDRTIRWMIRRMDETVAAHTPARYINDPGLRMSDELLEKLEALEDTRLGRYL